MKYAIVESGGKQYKAVPGETIRVDRLQDEVGEKIVLERVLFVTDDGELHIGTPLVEGAQVHTTLADNIKGPKIVVFKYKPANRYRVKQGHRQRYTLLKIDNILME
ncbi:MAG: 50S ribosomal protein L21 [Chloroflexi bacterium]|nr:50S ribosomal protein L21 [Chloroflexota bacterium]